MSPCDVYVHAPEIALIGCGTQLAGTAGVFALTPLLTEFALGPTRIVHHINSHHFTSLPSLTILWQNLIKLTARSLGIVRNLLPVSFSQYSRGKVPIASKTH
jgi:hypothetical protein